MKLRYIFTALAAALTLAVGCQESIEPHLDEVKVSSSYVAIPAQGGSDTITVNAVFDWTLSDVPEWLTVTPASGVAGETEVVFSAEATTSYQYCCALPQLQWRSAAHQRSSDDREGRTPHHSLRRCQQ